ncbi:MAG: thiamine pyrophosphate-binding protein [Gemmatimonadota bacterium]|nr:thiamine pyrophosphate-binding protein [Gemmatimonadota bacterium]
MAEMTGYRYMAEMMRGYGIRAVFHVPYILDGALVEMEKLGIRRIRCHSEKAAAYMADGYARVAHGPGIAMAQSVGAANLAAGLQDAWLACSPVIAVTGRWMPHYLYQQAYQEIDHRPLYDPVTKFNAYVDGVEQIPFLLRQAFREATTGAPRPVHLDFLGLSGDLAAGSELDVDVTVEASFARYPAFRPEPEPGRVADAAQRIARSQRPVLVAGGGVTASGAKAEVVRLAEKLSVPVATSLNAKGAIPENHPLSAGVVGTYSRKCANEIVSEADLVIFVGSHTGGQVSHFWQIPRQGTPVIQIDVDPAQIGRNYPAEVAIQGDAMATLERLIEVVAPVPDRTAWTERVRVLVDQWRGEFDDLLKSDAVPIRPERLCREITEFLPPDAILLSDTGHAGMWTGAMIEITNPGQTYLRCAGSLGWAFPAAMGAKCAAPDRPVICFTGDGGFWYHLGELETAARFGINTVTVINNNRSFNQCRDAFEDASGGRDQDSDDLWVFEDIDFAGVAKSMGCKGIRVEDPERIRPALEEAMAADGPVVVDVATDIDAMAPKAYVPE